MANKLSRRKVLSTFGLTGLGMLASTANASASNLVPLLKEGEVLLVFSTIAALKESASQIRELCTHCRILSGWR